MISGILSCSDNAKHIIGGRQIFIQNDVPNYRQFATVRARRQEEIIMQFIVGCIILLNVVLLNGSFLSMRKYDPTKCDVSVSEKVPVRVPYVETYKARLWGLFYKIKMRLNYRTEYKVIWKTETRCCNGYEESSHDSCVPHCSSGCEHGVCVQPETCKCNEGYQLSHFKSQCEPDCHRNCVKSRHAYCEAPNVCVCESGYEIADSREETFNCTPICRKPCQNGKCTAPDVCTCNDGYRLMIYDDLYCEPICHENCNKINHAYCKSPHVCVCESGYQLADPKNSTSACIPICKEPCENGKCTAPNVCICNSGYVNNGDGCVPKCTQNCLFGICTAPNTCTCNPGYRTNEKNVCEPICSEPCVKGKCIAPESCSCDDGYGLLNSSKYNCQPICEKACVNGVCTTPEVCTCNDGYWFNGPEEEKHVCKPYCRNLCEPYGTCIAPDTCSCFDGYRAIEPIENDIPDNTTREQVPACEPICIQKCINGKCIEPNVCQCNPGYRPTTSNDSSTCEPVCQTPCGSNSTCTEPNVCTCYPGYGPTMNDVGNNCEPICETSCTSNSSCTSPNVCTCNEGYLQDEKGLCKPFCSSCNNGTCVEPNVCQCLEGFVRMNNSICVPYCENNCENGDCLGPNECRCHDGFEMSRDNNSCVKSCRRVCNGYSVCVGDGCECSYGWSGPDCDLPTVCILLVDPNDKSLDGFTVHNKTNNTLMDARHYAPQCYRCNQANGNRSLCFVVPSDNGSSSVGCFIEMESPCYLAFQSNNKNSVSTMADTLAVVTIIIVTGATMATYILIRRHRKKKMEEVIAQSTIFRGSTSSQCLLPEGTASVH